MAGQAKAYNFLTPFNADVTFRGTVETPGVIEKLEIRSFDCRDLWQCLKSHSEKEEGRKEGRKEGTPLSLLLTFPSDWRNR